MPKRTINRQAAELSLKVKKELVKSAKNGGSIVEMAKKHQLDYAVVQSLLWQENALTLQGTKTIITRRLKSLSKARRQPDRDQLSWEAQENVDYLYYAAKEMQRQLDKVSKVKKSIDEILA